MEDKYKNACGADWRTDKYGIERCNYCGSFSVADAIRFLRSPGTLFSGSDWKYGWPHKFYIQPVNPKPELLEELAWETGPHINENTPGAEFSSGRWSIVKRGCRSHVWGKFYNRHLRDATDEEFAEFAGLSKERFGVEWGKDDKGIFYRAPATRSFYGYQQAGEIEVDGTVRRTL